MSFEQIPFISRTPLFLDAADTSRLDGGFNVDIHKYSNMLIYSYFPFVAALSLKHIDDELGQSMQMKQQTLDKLKRKYSKRSKNVSIVQDIFIDDFEMYIDDNVQLIPNSHADLMKSSSESSLIKLVIKQFMDGREGKSVGKDFENIYKLLNESCNNTFTQIQFSNENQAVLGQQMTYRITQVWQIFEQFFKHFDYLDYLYNYYKITGTSDSKEILNILRVLLEIGRSNTC